jgi:hypothetical protein
VQPAASVALWAESAEQVSQPEAQPVQGAIEAQVPPVGLAWATATPSPLPLAPAARAPVPVVSLEPAAPALLQAVLRAPAARQRQQQLARQRPAA